MRPVIVSTFLNRVIPGLLLTLCMAAPATAQADANPQLIFNRANQQLADGNIPQALELYHQLEQQRHWSGALFLNMGLSYIQMDSMGKAKYYFLKARTFEETRERAQDGLAYVESRFSRQSAVLPALPWQRALDGLQQAVGAPLLLGIGLLLLNLGIVLYIIPWFTRMRSTLLSRTALAVAAAGVLTILLSFYMDYRQVRYHEAVMVTREAAVREQPQATAAVVSQAFEGYTFTVDQYESGEHDGWSYIRMSNGQYGWIPTEEIMIL